MMRRRRTWALGLGAALGAAGVYAPDAHADPRVRGGFSLNGGYFGAASSADSAPGAAISLAGRVGVQIGDVFGLYYQNTPMGWILFEGPTFVGGSDYNSVLADFTIGDILGLGIGPSLDLISGGVLRASGGLVEPGAHGRVALLLGSTGMDRRQAFAIGIDPHVMYFNQGVLVSLTAGIGAEWY